MSSYLAGAYSVALGRKHVLIEALVCETQARGGASQTVVARGLSLVRIYQTKRKGTRQAARQGARQAASQLARELAWQLGRHICKQQGRPPAINSSPWNDL